MTPDEKSSDENRFRERRSAFSEGDEPRAPAPADPEEVRMGDEERPSGGEEPAGDELGRRSPVAGEAPEREPGPIGEGRPVGEPASGEGRPVGEPAGEEGAPAGEPAAPEEPDLGAVDFDRLDQMEIPEASFLEIVQPLEIQALQFLGAAPLTESGEKRVLPRWAKHVIDLLGLLEERTRGNLPEDERQYLEQVLTELRTRYLQVSR